MPVPVVVPVTVNVLSPRDASGAVPATVAVNVLEVLVTGGVPVPDGKGIEDAKVLETPADNADVANDIVPGIPFVVEPVANVTVAV